MNQQTREGKMPGEGLPRDGGSGRQGGMPGEGSPATGGTAQGRTDARGGVTRDPGEPLPGKMPGEGSPAEPGGTARARSRGRVARDGGNCPGKSGRGGAGWMGGNSG